MALKNSVFALYQNTNLFDIITVENKDHYKMIRHYDITYSEYNELNLSKISVKIQYHVEYIDVFLCELYELVHKPYMKKVKNIDVFLDKVKIIFDNDSVLITVNEINSIKELIGSNIANEILNKIKPWDI